MKLIDEILNNNKTKKISNHQSGGLFIVKSNSRVFGIQLIKEILEKQNNKNIIYKIKEDGDFVNRGDALISVRGAYTDIFSIKDICQNIISHFTSVMTCLDKYQKEIKDLNTEIIFKENTFPGLGEYYNQLFLLAGCKLVNKDECYLDENIWNNEDFLNIQEPLLYVEVKNMMEFNKAITSKVTHIICVDFNMADLEFVGANKLDKKVGVKANMTFANIHSYASKNMDFVIIDNFYNSVKNIEVKFKYFEE